MSGSWEIKTTQRTRQLNLENRTAKIDRDSPALSRFFLAVLLTLNEEADLSPAIVKLLIFWPFAALIGGYIFCERRIMACDSEEEVGRRFRQWRIETLDKTQAEVARSLGSNEHTISKIECGKMYPSVEMLCKMYRRHDVCMNWILTGEEVE